MGTVNLVIETNEPTAQYTARDPRDCLTSAASLVRGLAAGALVGKVSVSASADSPVAASATWTLTTVIATDVASVAGVDFTFTSSPSVAGDVEVDVPSALAFASSTDISTTTGKITESAHGYQTGMVGQLSTSSALPAGFRASTDYYVYVFSSGVYGLAPTYADAVAGRVIIPTTTGTGNQTFTPNANSFKAKQLADAVNAHATANLYVTATWAANVVTCTAHVKGSVGNFIPFTDSDSTIASTGSGYLAGGLGGAEATPVNFGR